VPWSEQDHEEQAPPEVRGWVAELRAELVAAAERRADDDERCGRVRRPQRRG
jgi:hypothetical protein